VKKLKKTINVYRLTDANGDKSCTVVNAPCDKGCIGGIGNDGEYHKFDSYELYLEWAEKLGMKVESAVMEIDIPENLFK